MKIYEDLREKLIAFIDEQREGLTSNSELNPSALAFDFCEAWADDVLTDDFLAQCSIEINGHDNIDAGTLVSTQQGHPWNRFGYGRLRDTFSANFAGLVSLVLYDIKEGRDSDLVSDVYTGAQNDFNLHLARLSSHGEKFRCGCCGMENIGLWLKSDEMKIMANPLQRRYDGLDATAPCPEYKAEPHHFEIAVPSGKMVFANDLRPLLPGGDVSVYNNKAYQDYFKDRGLYFDSTSLRHHHIESDYYAEQGLLMVAVGNSDPTLIEEADGLAFIDNYFEEYETAEEEALYTRFTKAKSHDSICTQVWIVTGIDYDRFEALAKEKGKTAEEALEDFDAKVVDINCSSLQVTDYRNHYKGRLHNSILIAMKKGAALENQATSKLTP